MFLYCFEHSPVTLGMVNNYLGCGPTNPLTPRHLKYLHSVGLLKKVLRPKQYKHLRRDAFFWSPGPKAIEFELRYNKLLDEVFNPPEHNSLPGLD